MGNLKHCTKGSNVAKHAWTFDHVIDFNNSKIIDKANNRSRKTLETWHTAKTIRADNNSCPLPRQYHILLKKHLFSSPFQHFSTTCFYLLIYVNFSLYLILFFVFTLYSFLSVEDSSLVCRKLIVFLKLFTRERLYLFLIMNHVNGSSIFLRAMFLIYLLASLKV